MRAWTRKLLPLLFAIGGLGWFIKTVKQVIREEPLDGTPIVIGSMFLVTAVVLLASNVTARNTQKTSGTPSP